MMLARRKLAEVYTSACFAPERETKPLYLKNPAHFSNQVAMFFTEEREEMVKKRLKSIERLSGRSAEDKIQEKVCLDIDLLFYGDKILKPEDWQRDYIQRELPTIDNLSVAYQINIK